MSQLRQGTVAVATASATVRGNYVTPLSPHTGTFTPGETVTWSGGGSAVAVAYNGATFTLTFHRTAGPVPVVGTALTGGTSGATGTVASFTAASVPRFDLDLAGGGPIAFEVPTAGIIYSVTATAADSFTLGTPYLGTADTASSYVVWRDFTPNRQYLLPKPGDVDAAGGFGRAISAIDSDMAGPARTTLTLASGWAAPAGSFGTAASFRKTADGEVRMYGACSRASGSAPQTVATMDAGYRSIGRRSWVVRCGISGTGILELAPATGVLTLLSGTGLSDGISLEGVSWFADA